MITQLYLCQPWFLWHFNVVSYWNVLTLIIYWEFHKSTFFCQFDFYIFLFYLDYIPHRRFSASEHYICFIARSLASTYTILTHVCVWPFSVAAVPAKAAPAKWIARSRHATHWEPLHNVKPHRKWVYHLTRSQCRRSSSRSPIRRGWIISFAAHRSLPTSRQQAATLAPPLTQQQVRGLGSPSTQRTAISPASLA